MSTRIRHHPLGGVFVSIETTGLEPISMQDASGILRPPVQKLVATIRFAPANRQSSPISSTKHKKSVLLPDRGMGSDFLRTPTLLWVPVFILQERAVFPGRSCVCTGIQCNPCFDFVGGFIANWTTTVQNAASHWKKNPISALSKEQRYARIGCLKTMTFTVRTAPP